MTAALPVDRRLFETRAGRAPLGRAGQTGKQDGLSHLRRELELLARRVGFYSGTYVHLGHAYGCEQVTTRLISSSAFGQRFFEGLLANELGARAAVACKAFAWSSLKSEDAMGRHFAAVVIPVQDHLYGPGFVVLLGTDYERAELIADESGPTLSYAAVDLHGQALCALGVRSTASTLTQREIECLRHAAVGLTVPATGKLLGIAGRTVEYHLANIATKLGATNKVHTVAIAVSKGLIHV